MNEALKLAIIDPMFFLWDIEHQFGNTCAAAGIDIKFQGDYLEDLNPGDQEHPDIILVDPISATRYIGNGHAVAYEQFQSIKRLFPGAQIVTLAWLDWIQGETHFDKNSIGAISLVKAILDSAAKAPSSSDKL